MSPHFTVLQPLGEAFGTHNGDFGCQKGVRKGSNRTLKPVLQKLLEKVVSICYLLCFSHVGHLKKIDFLLSFGVANWGASAGQETHVSKTHFGGSGGDLAASRVISKPHLGSLLESRSSKKVPWNVRLHSRGPKMALRSSQIGQSP